jgi:hypothetical protein
LPGSELISPSRRQASRHTLQGESLIRMSSGEPTQILNGDFNIDFSIARTRPLIDFLKTALDYICMSNDPKESTTKLWKKNQLSSQFCEKKEIPDLAAIVSRRF